MASSHSLIEAGRMIMMQMTIQQNRIKKFVFIDAIQPTIKPVNSSLLLALFSLYIAINSLNTISISAFSTKKTGLVWNGSIALSSKKDMAGTKPALSMSLWSVMILLRIKASASNNAVKIIFPNMPLDPSRKERYSDNALRMAVEPGGTAAFTVASALIAGK